MKSRDDPKQQSRRNRERHREQDRRGIDSDVGQARNALWLEAEQPVESPDGEKEAERAAVVFRSVEASAPIAATDDRTILLRNGAPRGPNDDSLYRYDRAGLVDALAARASAEGRR